MCLALLVIVFYHVIVYFVFYFPVYTKARFAIR